MRIFLAGHRGMVGGAILRRLRATGADEILTRTSAELDLTDQAAVARFMTDTRPDAVILAAAKVGGIHANNTYPADFIYENLMIEAMSSTRPSRAGVQQAAAFSAPPASTRATRASRWPRTRC